MRRLCAWCGKNLDKSPDLNDSHITHGICEPCAEEVSRNAARQRVLLDRIGKMAVTVDSKGALISANTLIENAVSLPHNEILGILSGDLLGCKYAKSPQGCGHTAHCSACTVREAIMGTHRTNHGVKHIKTVLHTESGSLALWISTEKIGDVVMLQIDREKRL